MKWEALVFQNSQGEEFFIVAHKKATAWRKLFEEISPTEAVKCKYLRKEVMQHDVK